MPNTVDSNSTGLSYCYEVYGSPGTISTPTWRKLQPNSYGTFGGNVRTVARSPIAEGRQNSKGVIVDQDAAVAFENDFTQNNFNELMPALFFADWHESFNATPSATNTTDYTVASSTGVLTNSLVFGAGFTNSGNNGLKKVTGTTGTTITTGSLTAETPPATAKLTVVGYEGASGDITLTVSGDTATLGTTTLNCTTLGLLAGQWIWIGGDTAGTKFATAASNGFYRISSIAASSIVCDRIPTGAATDNGSGKTLRLFWGHFIHNEDSAANIKKYSLRFERFNTTSNYQTIDTCYAGSMTLNVRTADKVTANWSFTGGDESFAASAEGTGTRATLVDESAFNGTSHVKYLRVYDDSDNAALAAYVTDLTVTINNNPSPVKAVSVLGNLDTSVGNFTATATMTAYYTDNTAVEAVQANNDIGVSVGLVAANAGWMFDIPLCSVGQAEVRVEKDRPITLPLTAEGARHPTLTYTASANRFVYLPDLAE